MGVSLNRKANFLSTGSIEIKGMSIDIATQLKSSFLDEICFKSSKVEISDDFVKRFFSFTCGY